MHHFMDFTVIFSDDHCASVQQGGCLQQDKHFTTMKFDSIDFNEEWSVWVQVENCSKSYSMSHVCDDFISMPEVGGLVHGRNTLTFTWNVKRTSLAKKKVKQLTLICNFRWSLARSMTYEHVKSVMTLGNHYSLSLSHYVSVWVTAIITQQRGKTCWGDSRRHRRDTDDKIGKCKWADERAFG